MKASKIHRSLYFDPLQLANHNELTISFGNPSLTNCQTLKDCIAVPTYWSLSTQKCLHSVLFIRVLILHSLQIFTFCPFEVRFIIAAPRPTDRWTINPNSVGTECLWRSFISLMETTLSAPIIYLPWKLLNRGTTLINPNCGKDVTVVASQAAPCSSVTNYILQCSSRGKKNKLMKYLLFSWVGVFQLLRKNNVHILTTSTMLRSLVRSFRGINSFKKSFISLLCECVRNCKRKGEAEAINRSKSVRFWYQLFW